MKEELEIAIYQLNQQGKRYRLEEGVDSSNRHLFKIEIFDEDFKNPIVSEIYDLSLSPLHNDFLRKMYKKVVITMIMYGITACDDRYKKLNQENPEKYK